MQTLASEFQALPHLSILSITSTQWFKPSSPTEFEADMEDGERWIYLLKKQDKHHLSEDPTEVAREFFALCRHLTVFRVLQYRWNEKYRCERDGDGSVRAVKHIESADDWDGVPTRFSKTWQRNDEL
jgi:hypothetical protein